MTTNTPFRSGQNAPRARRGTRSLAVVAGAAAALLAWLVTAKLAGTPLDVRTGSGEAVQSVGVAAVVVAAVTAGLGGWASLAVLERLVPARARAVWTALAVVVLVLSLAGPLDQGTTTGAKAGLVGLHLVTGMVLVPALARTAARR
ncbi:DUF6069 family protein [Streptomyces sporangiiformans]|uniref:DUF6069 family protein n=1 Tax=Streptomyces sporangiiformans TaxID=2315329 RepID=UPI000E5AD298|nr:DUF6069 family protein [Streptomyces sporangiiformans]